MTKDELVAKLHGIEWEDFEVKSTKSELPKNVWESVSAFSNISGALIVVGVKQTGIAEKHRLRQEQVGELESTNRNPPDYRKRPHNRSRFLPFEIYHTEDNVGRNGAKTIPRQYIIIALSINNPEIALMKLQRIL